VKKTVPGRLIGSCTNQQPKVMIMTIQFSRQGMAAIPTTAPVGKASFARRLLQARDDAAKRRVHAWLLEIDDDRLLGFGLTPEDIALLRGTTAPGCR